MRIFLICIFLLHIVFLNAQGGFRSRITLPGSLTNVAKAVFEVSPGNYISAGIAFDSASGSNRLVVMGLNAGGTMQWIKKYGNVNFEHLDNSFISRSFYKLGNAIFYTGCVKDSNAKYTGVLIKFDLNGDTLWQKIYRDTSEDLIPQMLTPGVDDGFLLTGFFQDWVNHTRPCLLIKTDANGNELWRKVINKAAPNVHDGRAIAQDSATKKIVIVGYQYVGNQNSWNTRDNILILDSLGNVIAQKYYNAGYLNDLIQTKDKKFIAVGNTETYSSLDNSYYSNSYMVKFDINNPNQPIWKNNIYDQVALINTFGCLKELPNGDLLIAGSIDSLKITDTLSNTHIRYIRVNSIDGKVKWRKDYEYNMITNAYNDLRITSLELTNDGGWVSAIRVYNPYYNPLFYVKYDSTGCDTVEHWCRSVALGVSEFNETTGWSFDLFPNPAKGFVNLRVEVPSTKKLGIKINDLSGRELQEFTLDFSTTTIDLTKFDEGVYFVSIIYNNKIIETKRLLIVN